MPYGTFVEERIHGLSELARVREGIEPMSDGQLARAADVRRAWAYPEIAALVATAVGFVLALITALDLPSPDVGGVVQTRRHARG